MKKSWGVYFPVKPVEQLSVLQGSWNSRAGQPALQQCWELEKTQTHATNPDWLFKLQKEYVTILLEQNWLGVFFPLLSQGTSLLSRTAEHTLIFWAEGGNFIYLCKKKKIHSYTNLTHWFPIPPCNNPIAGEGVEGWHVCVYKRSSLFRKIILKNPKKLTKNPHQNPKPQSYSIILHTDLVLISW